jgi:hypothetical protein
MIMPDCLVLQEGLEEEAEHVVQLQGEVEILADLVHPKEVVVEMLRMSNVVLQIEEREVEEELLRDKFIIKSLME